jgi:hypothetical protein
MRTPVLVVSWVFLQLAAAQVAYTDEPKQTITNAVISGDQELPYREIGQAFKVLQKHGIKEISLKVDYNLREREEQFINRDCALVTIVPTVETSQEEYFRLRDALAKQGAVLTAHVPPSAKKSAEEPGRLSRFDPQLPYTLEYVDQSYLSWGSFRYLIDSEGTGKLYKYRKEGDRRYREMAELKLTPAVLQAITKTLASDDFVAAQENYIDPDIRDGTSLRIILRQGDKQKTIFCSNQFPPFFEQLTNEVTAGFKTSGLEEATWTRLTLIEWMKEGWP